MKSLSQVEMISWAVIDQLLATFVSAVKQALYGRLLSHIPYLTIMSWSSVVEGDDQLDWPNSQTSMEYCYIIFSGLLKTQQLTTKASTAYISFY